MDEEDNDVAARQARANRWHELIDELTKGKESQSAECGTAGAPDDVAEPAASVESPRDFIHRKMWEQDEESEE